MKCIHLYDFGPNYNPYDIWSNQEIDIRDFDSYEEAIKISEQMIKEGKLSEYDTYVI